ncbi:MAG: radical SAM protein, partial [Planctomycetota bacterium]
RLGVPVVMGGIHPSALPEEALEHCDAVCRGDAESTLPQLIAEFEAARGGRGELGKWEGGEVGAGGVGQRHSARGADDVRRWGMRAVYNWADYPAAPIATPRKDVIEAGDYLVANPIQTTRGCPHDCNFCTTPAVFGRKIRQRSIASIIEEMRAVCDGAGRKPWCFIFADDNFAGNQAWALELCEAMKPLGISWASQCDILISRNDRLLRAMRASGCQGLILGLESPRQETLHEAGKKFVQSDTYAARIRKIQSFGISLWGAFIFGFDSDTWADCRAACRFAQRTDLAMSCYPILTPYPGTEFFRQFVREGRLRTRDWERYNGASVVFEPQRMSVKELRHAQMAAFAEFFSLRSAFGRLRMYPLKTRAWVANLAIWKGIRYYYAKKHRRVPQFRDFFDRDARAWNYPVEEWATAEARAAAAPARDLAAASAGAIELELLIAQAAAMTNPLVQAGGGLAAAAMGA